MSKVISLNIIEKKHGPKKSLKEAELIEDYGFKGDVHSGKGDRQVTLFGEESRFKMESIGTEGLCMPKFFENITTSGIELFKLHVGAGFQIGKVEFEISIIGKECYDECDLFRNALECALSKECIFAKVIKGGIIKIGDSIKILQ